MSTNMSLSFTSSQPLNINTISNPIRLCLIPKACSTQPPIPPTSKTPITAPSLESLEADYKAKKATYKAAKALYKAAKKATECKEKDTKMKKPKLDEQQPTQSIGTISVCSGSSCLRHGSEAVAAILTPKIPPNAKCMKMCGGIGPTICVDGVPSKVNLKAAIQGAVTEAAEKVKDKTAIADIGDNYVPVNIQ